MELSDVIALAKAGFTAEQIGQLMKANTNPPEPAPEPVPEPVPAPVPAPAPTPAPAPIPDDNVSQKIDFLTQLIQNSNVINSNQPKPETVDDIIANIISPNKPVKEE